jgi:hypothetical protein
VAALAVVQLTAATAVAQTVTEQKILDRLDLLEKQNQALLEEIKALREAVKAQSPPGTANTSDAQDTNDRVTRAEDRIAEQAQTKVGTAQHLPLTLNGMILFDASQVQGTSNNGFQQSYGSYGEGAPGGGATLRQSIIGVNVQGPSIAGGGKINGSLSMDFYAGSNASDVFRIRNGDISFDWANRSISVGQEKTVIAPLQPTSFAHVGIPALTGAGNLWLWRPQVKYEERHSFTSNTGIVLDGALFSTQESSTTIPSVPSALASGGPAIQGRIGLTHSWTDQDRFAIGIGAHESQSHIAGQSIPSRVISADFLYKPLRWIEVTGTVFKGENFANLGGLPVSVASSGNGSLIAVKGTAGWMQLALPVTNRLTFNTYAGRQVNASRFLGPFQIGGSLVYAGNVLYRIGPNVVLGFEAGRENIVYANRNLILANRYDATLAYLF